MDVTGMNEAERLQVELLRIKPAATLAGRTNPLAQRLARWVVEIKGTQKAGPELSAAEHSKNLIVSATDDVHYILWFTALNAREHPTLSKGRAK
jgi:hypothetical protein